MFSWVLVLQQLGTKGWTTWGWGGARRDEANRGRNGYCNCKRARGSVMHT